MKRENPKRGDGVFYRDGSLYISWTSATGKRMKRRANTNLLKEARDERAGEMLKVKQTKENIRLYGILPPTEKTFTEVAAEYLAEKKGEISDSGFSRTADIIRLHLEPFFAGQFSHIRPSTIKRYVAKRKEDAASPATVCKELNLVKAIFSFAVRSEYLPSSPAAEIRGPKIPTKEQPYLETTEDCQRLLDACQSWLKPVVAFGISTGLRLGRILDLEWRNVDLNKATLHLPKDKNGEPFHAHLNDNAMRVLLLMAGVVGKKMSPSGHVFGYYGKHNRASVATKRAVIKAGLNPDLHFHNTRHTFCAHSLMLGNDAITVQKRMGHKTASMTRRYAHLSDEHMREAAARENSAFAGLMLPEADGTQMRTNGAPKLLTTAHACSKHENIQPTQNTGEREINA